MSTQIDQFWTLGTLGSHFGDKRVVPPREGSLYRKSVPSVPSVPSEASRIVEICAAIGVSLWEEDGLVRYRGPSSALSPELLESIERHKLGLLTLVRQTNPTTEVEETASKCPNWTPRPLPWRPIVAAWPIPLRERWGRRANELMLAGTTWPDDEIQAFEELSTNLVGKTSPTSQP
jgi:TubC N-terminal docking domain